MRLAIIVIVLFLGFSGLMALINPKMIVTWTKRLMSSRGRYFAAGIRLVMGTVLLLASDSSKDPKTLDIIGSILVVSGLLVLVTPQKMFNDLLSWFGSWNPTAIRVWGIVVIAAGYGLVYLMW